MATQQLPGFPEALAGVELTDAAAHLIVDEHLYPLDALYGASYIFIDRCYVLLDRPEAGRHRVTLSPKKGATDEAALRALVGEFANELLSCAWRHQIAKDNRATIEAVTMQAIGGAMGQPSLDELAAFDFSADAFEDPLGIATSWEEKYKKKSPADKDGGAPATAKKDEQT
jgi:His-Xaa-Ser system protein HxsD